MQLECLQSLKTDIRFKEKLGKNKTFMRVIYGVKGINVPAIQYYKHLNLITTKYSYK